MSHNHTRYFEAEQDALEPTGYRTCKGCGKRSPMGYCAVCVAEARRKRGMTSGKFNRTAGKDWPAEAKRINTDHGRRSDRCLVNG